jgi:uncharacterized protein
MQRSVDWFRGQGQGKLPAGGLKRICLDSGQEGPTVVVVGGVHGDELTGMAVWEPLESALGEQMLCGKVVGIPCANPEGLVRYSRVIPGDEVDLNRCFPGNPYGSRGEQLANGLWAMLGEARPDLVLDLHSDSAHAIPYAIVDRDVSHEGEVRTRLEGRMKHLAAASGFFWIWEYPDEVYRRSGLERSLSGSVVNTLGLPAITLEVGPKAQVDPASVQAMLGGVLGVLSAMGMVHSDITSAPIATAEYRRESAPRCERGGLLFPMVLPGEAFQRGDALGHIRQIGGEIVETLYAANTGKVLSWSQAGWLQAGQITGTLAVVDRENF